MLLRIFFIYSLYEKDTIKKNAGWSRRYEGTGGAVHWLMELNFKKNRTLINHIVSFSWKLRTFIPQVSGIFYRNNCTWIIFEYKELHSIRHRKIILIKFISIAKSRLGAFGILCFVFCGYRILGWCENHENRIEHILFVLDET